MFRIILFILCFINGLLFWQISALDLEYINVNLYLQVLYFGLFFLLFFFCY